VRDGAERESSLVNALRLAELRARCVLPMLALALAGCSPAPRSGVTAPASAPDHCEPAPSGERLFLRGAMTTWALREDLALDYV